MLRGNVERVCSRLSFLRLLFGVKGMKIRRNRPDKCAAQSGRIVEYGNRHFALAVADGKGKQFAQHLLWLLP